MQKKKINKKIIIAITILLTAVLATTAIILSKPKQIPQTLQEIAKANYTTTIGNYEYDITNIIQNPSEIVPTLSAGMIPIKRDGENWVISNKNEEDWYNYADYKPAYMMLNDGVYQSELVRNMEEKGKKLASENLGVEIKEEELGTIYMWVPRIADDRNNFAYIKQECTPYGTYRTYNAFISKGDKWDYSYAGLWVEYKPLGSEAEVTTKVNNLNKGENDEIYGFLANTKAYDLFLEDWSLYSFLDRYIYSLSAKTMEYHNIGNEEINIIKNANILKDLELNNGLYRTVLRVSETNKLEPIKAESYFDTEKEQIIIDVTHNKNPIKEVLFANGEKLEFTTTNGKTVANTGRIEIGTGKYSITIIDIDGNAYEFKANGVPIYATLYTDGTLGISKGKTTISGKTPKVSYGDIQLSTKTPAWRDEATTIKTVNFVNKVQPISTANWFYNCTSLTTIYSIGNLDTSKVTQMYNMFYNCSALTSLNVSNFDTSNVASMSNMFYNCSALTSLNVSNFDTSNVTNMGSMFYRCRKLTTLDVSKFNTSKVTNMAGMFAGCNALTTLDVSNFDTSKVTSMNSMFSDSFTTTNYIYMNLTNLDLSNFDTTNVRDMTNMFCGCNKLTTLNLSNFDTSNVTSMGLMFQGCNALTTLNLSSFNTSKVTNMQGMFWRCTSLTSLNLTSFDTSNVTNMKTMFYYCSRLKSILVNKSTWVEPENKDQMFNGCGTSTLTKQ